MTTKKEAAEIEAALSNWTALNDALRTASEHRCALLLDRERLGKRRIQYLLRIHARFNKQRADRERRELMTAEAAA